MGELIVILIAIAFFVLITNNKESDKKAHREANKLNSDLEQALTQKNLEKAVGLINEGAYVNTKCKMFGYTALHLAAKQKRPDYIDVLLNAGADVNFRSNEGDTALLDAAIQGGDINCFKRLIRAGADVNAKNSQGWTALRLSVTSLNYRTGTNYRIFSYLMAERNTVGLDMNPIDDKGFTPLMHAIWVGYDVVEELIEAGADINRKTFDRFTALMTAVNRQEPKIVSLLIAKGAHLDAANEQGRTALHLASMKDYVESGKALIEKGANLNIKDADGKTPLLLAAEFDAAKIASSLLNHGADISVTDNDGKDAMQLANEKHSFKVLPILKEFNSSG